MAMPERIWATPLGEPDGGFWYSPCADKTDKTEYVLATTHQRTLEALERFMAIANAERWNDGSDPAKDAAAYHGAVALARNKEATP